MREVSYDKSTWGEGPWQTEPDRKEWRTATGLPGLIVRNRSGALCGYVGVGPDHPWHGVWYGGCTQGCETKPYNWPEQIGDTKFPPASAAMKTWAQENPRCETYEHSPEGQVSVHGGLTYSAGCQENGPICHTPAPGEPDNVWWFGFDCAHYMDLAPGLRAQLRTLPGLGHDPDEVHKEDVYRDLAYVEAEVERLAEQLKAVK